MAWVIRNATLDDLPALFQLEQQCFVDGWSMDMLQRELEHDWSHVDLLEDRDPIAQTEPTLAGFCISWWVLDEVHLQQIAISPSYRQQGLASKLLESLLHRAKQAHAERIFLEVRASNTPALALYRRFSFSQIGTRKAYYEDPTEDAVVFECNLPSTTLQIRP